MSARVDLPDAPETPVQPLQEVFRRFGKVVLESVWGDGPEWRHVPSTALAPHNAICQLEITFDNGDVRIGSGTRIGRRMILTAAHNIFHDRTKNRAETIVVSPGRNGTLPPGSQITSSSFDMHPQWVASNASDYDFDIGAVLFGSGGHASNGELDWAVPSDPVLLRLEDVSDWGGERINVAGYPIGNGKNGDEQWFDYGAVTSSGPATIFHRLDTMGGNSGAPVYYSKPGESGIVIGVHTGDGGVGSNRSVRITEEISNMIQTWHDSGEPIPSDGS